MAALRVAAPKMASVAASSSIKVARSPMMTGQLARAYSVATRTNTPFNTIKRSSTILNAARTKVSPIGAQAKRAYSSEMASAIVEASQYLGTGMAVIGLAGPGVGIGLVFYGLLQAMARNPSLSAQLFSRAILGFAFVEAIALFDLMVAFMNKFL